MTARNVAALAAVVAGTSAGELLLNQYYLSLGDQRNDFFRLALFMKTEQHRNSSSDRSDQLPRHATLSLYSRIFVDTCCVVSRSLLNPLCEDTIDVVSAPEWEQVRR